MDVLTHVVIWLNAVANALGRWLLWPIGYMPGWLSATLVAAVTGVMLLVVFKYTSNQQAIQRVRDDIKAHLLALRLFKDSTSVLLRSQARILRGAAALALLAIVPMSVMMVPVTLFLGQLSLWYQARPLRVGEEAVMTVTLNGTAESSWPDVRLEPTTAVEVIAGPVRVTDPRAFCWNLKARENGDHGLGFHANDDAVDKELVIGDGFRSVSIKRPRWCWSEALLYPSERPLGPKEIIQSIAINYPQRSSWTCGGSTWIIYWFVASMVAALCFRRWLNVKI